MFGWGSFNNMEGEIEKCEKLSEDACLYIKENKKHIIKTIAGNQIISEKEPVSVFMAGSPGAGKTEVSKQLIDYFAREDNKKPARIDPDEIRTMIPAYNGKNASLFQEAVTLGVNKVHDFVLDKNKSFILDGTFSNFEKAKKNIERSIRHKRRVWVVYLFLNPEDAWDITQKREVLDNRNIPIDAFVEHFFNAKICVDEIKKIFKDKIEINVLNRAAPDSDTGIKCLELNVGRIDSKLFEGYDKKTLIRALQS